MKISVIVPVLNEYKQLQNLIPELVRLNSCVHEVIVVDGGSTDDTCNVLTSAGFSPLPADTGRARQMNKGAAEATGDLLWFIHADTRFISSVSDYIRVFETINCDWGRFNILLSGSDRIFRLIEWFINKRSALTAIATGDQGIFISRKLFDTVSGYADIPIMEDIDICGKLKKIKSPVNITWPVLMTSSRRWERYGVLRTILLMWKMRWLYFTGVSATKLSHLYHQK